MNKPECVTVAAEMIIYKHCGWTPEVPPGVQIAPDRGFNPKPVRKNRLFKAKARRCLK